MRELKEKEKEKTKGQTLHPKEDCPGKEVTKKETWSQAQIEGSSSPGIGVSLVGRRRCEHGSGQPGRGHSKEACQEGECCSCGGAGAEGKGELSPNQRSRVGERHPLTVDGDGYLLHIGDLERTEKDTIKQSVAGPGSMTR